MKNLFLFVIAACFSTTFIAAQNNIVFNGNSLSSYINQNVTFNQTLYVCGQDYQHIFLSYERLRQPEETAIAGTAEYRQDSIKCAKAVITAYFPNVSSDTLRLGATLTNLQAKVTGDREITVNGTARFDNNNRPTTIPNVGDARLTICSANLQYYCPEWQGTNGASSDAEFQVQNQKIINALYNIQADIFALIELQEGTNAISRIVDALNARTVPGRYAYVNDGNAQTSTYVKIGFVYRTDKVSPVLMLGRPYSSYSSYYRREYVQAFTELSTNARFVLSLNHFKAKDGTGSESTNDARMDNVEHLIDFLTQQANSNYYQDPDFLIVGDLNCSTMEEPIRYIASHGYENQLTRFSPTGYSYVYDNKVEYLDHVFASHAMASQVTGAAAYHINADEFYRHGYTYGDVTMYRYSDHDPIIVGLKLDTPSSIAEEAITNNYQVYSQDGCLRVHSDTNETVDIYDAMGRCLYHNNAIQDCSLRVSTGIYIVRIGKYTQKICISNL